MQTAGKQHLRELDGTAGGLVSVQLPYRQASFAFSIHWWKCALGISVPFKHGIGAL